MLKKLTKLSNEIKDLLTRSRATEDETLKGKLFQSAEERMDEIIQLMRSKYEKGESN